MPRPTEKPMRSRLRRHVLHKQKSRHAGRLFRVACCERFTRPAGAGGHNRTHANTPTLSLLAAPGWYAQATAAVRRATRSTRSSAQTSAATHG